MNTSNPLKYGVSIGKTRVATTAATAKIPAKIE
jgi:hypothetical protein